MSDLPQPMVAHDTITEGLRKASVLTAPLDADSANTFQVHHPQERAHSFTPEGECLVVDALLCLPEPIRASVRLLDEGPSEAVNNFLYDTQEILRRVTFILRGGLATETLEPYGPAWAGYDAHEMLSQLYARAVELEPAFMAWRDNLMAAETAEAES